MLEVKILYSPIDQTELDSLVAAGWEIYYQDNRSVWLRRPKP
jgi:hypothetical protein